jgi:formate hydrogenlyase subunit 3/multisubunit Na+/H+ antiporter MnhD subunit
MAGDIGKIIIFIGLLLVVIGFVWMVGNKLPFIGKLPGDIAIERKNYSFYFPVTTCIIISIILFLFYGFLIKDKYVYKRYSHQNHTYNAINCKESHAYL